MIQEKLFKKIDNNNIFPKNIISYKNIPAYSLTFVRASFPSFKIKSLLNRKPFGTFLKEI